MEDKKIFCIPRMGKYTDIFIKLFEELGLNMMKAPEITNRTIKLGVKYSPEMICYPFKVTLGNFIECLDLGATDLIMYNSCGTCRFKQYHMMQNLIMKDLDYKFDMHQIRPRRLIFDLRDLNKENSYLKVIKLIKKYWIKIKEMEETYNYKINPNEINIGVVGEIFTVLEPKINLDLINRLEKKGVRVHTFVNVRSLIKDAFGLRIFSNDANLKKARRYIYGNLGGHGVENIRDTIYFSKNNIDGIVHLMPLTCMPESTVEPVLNKICYDNSIPLLRLPIDETNSELNIETRVETFVELIKRRKIKLKT